MSLALSPAARDLMQTWLGHLASLRDAADATVDAYGRDLADFLGFQAEYQGDTLGTSALRSIEARDMRAWMAAQRSRGVGARSLARRLSAVKAFYRWWADR